MLRLPSRANMFFEGRQHGVLQDRGKAARAQDLCGRCAQGTPEEGQRAGKRASLRRRVILVEERTRPDAVNKRNVRPPRAETLAARRTARMQAVALDLAPLFH